ncbi:polysaccharide pyruvyl transferase CsaB [Rubidibacter lacunae KORDI 51-2]|uniref:Polysaccharide pyruvyl transferase CsaB n=1 Tax=Rubidibacter lacunae KORDI 51-2 TaxID=582515 RepID=U5DTY9_9CHRO|nr:polysaccharide pyruvyl transferase CsaB [Rubidibacter lacunae]ERN43140.1 polysaccharide pyruvyl transferase CsaB [Rubidibacter lacunae KORDI 51-2]
MTSRRALLCGYYGCGNAGDEALLAALLQMLPVEIEPVVLSANPAQTRALGVEAHSSRSAFAILRALNAADAFIWGGGSLIQDATSWRSPLYYCSLMALAQKRGLKTIAWAQGIGPINLPLTRWVARQTFAHCTAVSVRDRVSAQLLAEWEIPAAIAPDPVWALESKSLKGLLDLPVPRVAVTLRAHPLLTPERLQTLIAALVNFQKATRTCVLAVPFQPERDRAIAEAIVSTVPNAHLVSTTDPRELKGVFRGVELAIGMRLHSLIAAAAAGCRCFALSYDPKIDRLRTELNLPGWKLDELPEDAATMATTWLDFYANGNALTPMQVQSLSDRAGIHREVLLRVFADDDFPSFSTDI